MDRARIHEGIRRMRFTDVLGRSERSELSQMEASELLGISERTFRRWRDRHRDDGLPDLDDRRLVPSPRRAGRSCGPTGAGHLDVVRVSVPAEAAWWFDCVEFGQVEVADRLQRIGDGAVLQADRQSLQPGRMLSLQRGQFGDSVPPTLGATAVVDQSTGPDHRRTSSSTSGTAACLTFGIGQGPFTDRLARHGSTPKRDVTKPRSHRRGS